MLALRNIRTVLLLGLAVLLIAGTAAGKNERAAKRNADRQAKTAAKAKQRQARAAQRQTNNQARRQAASERRSAQQAKVAQIKVNNQARKQAATERLTARRANAAQKRAENQVRVEAVRQVRTERREEKREQTAQNRQAKAEQRVENQLQRQENRQARVEQQAERHEQTVQKRAEIVAARNENKPNVIKNVKRDVNVRRNNGRTTNRNANRTVVRDTRKRLERPTVVRPHRYPDGNRLYRKRDDRSIHVRRRFPGRRPGNVFRQIVWRNYGYPVYYRHGPDLFVHYVRPVYHRKYVFVSFGTYWPAYYSNLRYSWYGLHPYNWYGSYPTAYEVGSDTYNYYTYNTYNYDSGTTQDYTTSEYTGPLESVDETTFEDIRQKLTEQSQQQPEPETLVDKFFEDGVVAFEQEDYETAAKAFADAIALEPNDLILPFAYVQALFASEQYSRAANILRLALVQMPSGEQGLFFPRGLYSDDEILFGQIDRLHSTAESFAYDPDMSFLLGYQLIGTERHNEARQWLERASQYEMNKDATVILLDLLDKLEEQSEGASENNL